MPGDQANPGPTAAERAAAELAAAVAREEDSTSLLEAARARRRAAGGRGRLPAYSEFRLAALAALAGLAMIGLGVLASREDLIDSGTGIVQVSVGGYAASRGLAKIATPKKDPTP